MYVCKCLYVCTVCVMCVCMYGRISGEGEAASDSNLVLLKEELIRLETEKGIYSLNVCI